MHGGESSSGAQLADLWLFDPGTASWIEANISPTGPRPCARSSHCLAFADSSVGSADCSSATTVGSLIVFGGLGDDGGDDIEESPDGDAEDSMPLNDLWVLSPASVAWLRCGGGRGGNVGALAGQQCPLPVWSLVMIDGVGPSPRSLAALVPRPSRSSYSTNLEGSDGGGSDSGGGDDGVESMAELFLFGGYGLVELPGPNSDEGCEDRDSEEGGEIIVAYIDDLWGLSLPTECGAGGGDDDDKGAASDHCNRGEESKEETLAARGNSSGIGWLDEEGMGYAGPSPVEGRNGHTLTWCGDQLVLFGGFVGDGFDSGVHVAEPPSPLAARL